MSTTPRKPATISHQPTFWLGTHLPDWLGRAGVPLMISARRLRARRSLPEAAAPWVIDSGAFTQLKIERRWTWSAAEYAELVARCAATAGLLQWAAPMDWTCDRASLAKTGLTVEEHVERTVESYLELTAIAPTLPWLPVLQGWTLNHYERCASLYADAGVDLAAAPVVGIGSLIGRQSIARVQTFISYWADQGLRLHAFGLKGQDLVDSVERLASVDSMAWSATARYEPPLEGHTHRRCSSCLEFALSWRADQLRHAGIADSSTH